MKLTNSNRPPKRIISVVTGGKPLSKVGKRLAYGGLPDTRGNAYLYQLGQAVVLLAAVFALYKLIWLGFPNVHDLKTLFWWGHFLIALAPSAVLGLCYLPAKQRAEALALGIYHQAAPILILAIPTYPIAVAAILFEHHK